MRTSERIERRLWAGGDGLDGSGRDGPPRPRRRLAVGALGAVALLVALLALQQLGGGEARKPEDGKRGTRTATAARRTLVERESVEGTLGYSGARAVVNRLATGDGSAGGGPGGGGNPSGGGSGGGAPSGSGGSDTGSASASGSNTGSASSAGSGSGSGSSSGQSTSFGGQRASDGRRSSKGAHASVASQASGPDAAGDDRGAGGKRDRKGSRDGKGKGGKRGDRDERRAGDCDRGRDRRCAYGDGSHGGRGSGGSGGSKDSGAGSGGGGGGGRPDGGPNGGGGGSAGGGASQGSGTVTRLAREGSIVDHGETLYELDNRPVLLMYGSVPAYRELSTATTDGPDIRQLEQNLAALGFGVGVTVDQDFTAATAAAVKRWQRSLGLPETGEIELGRVVFLPGARRVGSHKTKLGSVLGTGAEVFETTSVKRVVTVELDGAKQSLVRRGDTVTVTLPDGTTVSGRIARVGRVARKKDDDGGSDGGVPSGGSGSEGGELVIDLSIVLGSRRGGSRLDQAPVTVGIAQETRRNALAVPVTALVARLGGGYGVEVVRGGRRRIVAVETGLFASGLVEISGRGIRAGTKVAIPEEA